MILLRLITFLSAFLLFQIELIIAKLFLPNYGGSYLVWGACVVFFQAVLLLGYLLAHAALRRWPMATYIKIHLVALLIPFLFFPGQPIHVEQGAMHVPLVLDIFARLLMTIGPVFLVLSTMSMITQAWLASSRLSLRDNPYALYAVSNLGSFAGLFTYPFIFEQFFSNTQQLNCWRLLYVVLVVLNVLAWRQIKIIKMSDYEAEGTGMAACVDWRQMIRWLLLSAGGVVMFLSVTNIMTYEVAPVPLLWIIPLGIYLLAFVLNFKKNPWCPSWMISQIGGIIGIQAAMYFWAQQHVLPVILVIVFLCVGLFCLCMYTQHELISTKPHRKSDLTLFYVMISLGGFLGGMLTSWIIPVLSNTLIEYMVGLFVIAVALKEKGLHLSRAKMILALYGFGLVFWLWPHLFRTYHLSGAILLVSMAWLVFSTLAFNKRIFVAMLGVLILLTPLLEPIWKNVHFIIKQRNYYGIYELYDNASGIRSLIHGTTLHGVQLKGEKERRIPIGYYSPTSAPGALLIKDIFQAKRIAVVGLGTGTLSMYAKPDCPIDFYELDPDVYTLATKYFWYIQEAPGPLNFIMGDARVSLDKVKDIKYDLLFIDAFGGDAIPVHLVNKDVIVQYRQILAPRGAMVFHITNRYINLEPVLANIAFHLNAHVAVKNVGNDQLNLRSIWCILTWDDERFLTLITQEGWNPLGVDPLKRPRVWSDDFSTVLPLINFNEFLGTIENFKPLTW